VEKHIRQAMDSALARLRRLESLAELRQLAAKANVLVVFTADDCECCPTALFNIADLSRRYAGAVELCWARLEDNHDIVLNYAVTEYPSAVVLRPGAPPEKIAGRQLADSQVTRRVLDAASK